MMILKIIVVIILIIAIGVGMEMLIHSQVDVMKATYLLKDDVAKVIKALCTKEPVRHVFDETLFCDKKIL